MIKKILQNDDLHDKAYKALKSAVRKLIKQKKKTGEPLIVWKNGRVVKLRVDQI